MAKSTMIGVALVFLCSFASAAQQQWASFSNDQGRFKVLLPGKPTQIAESPATFSLSSKSAIYVMSYTDGHDGADWAQTVNSERDVTIQGLNGKASQEKEISLDGYRGKSTNFECNLPSGPFTGPAAGQVRTLFNGHRFYILIGLAPKGSKGEEISRFLNSFQLLRPAKQ